jgi:hypothetical protein
MHFCGERKFSGSVDPVNGYQYDKALPIQRHGSIPSVNILHRSQELTHICSQELTHLNYAQVLTHL